MTTGTTAASFQPGDIVTGPGGRATVVSTAQFGNASQVRYDNSRHVIELNADLQMWAHSPAVTYVPTRGFCAHGIKLGSPHCGDCALDRQPGRYTYCGAGRLGYGYSCREQRGHEGDHKFISPVRGVTNTWPQDVASADDIVSGMIADIMPERLAAIREGRAS